MILALQALLALAYAVLAHAASTGSDRRFGAAALLVLALVILLKPLSRRRPWAWIALPLLGLGIFWLYRHDLVNVPMLLVPVALMAMVAWLFARTLHAGRVPLITRIVSAMDKTAPDALPADLRSYTRNLTAAWAWLLALLAALNLLLALISVPNGLLAQLDWQAPVAISQAQWSLFANLANYGVIGGFFVLEYNTRKWRFPGRYRNFAEFIGKMSALGPGFWKDFLR